MADGSAANMLKMAVDNGRIDVLRSLLAELSLKPKELHETIDTICTPSGSLLHYATELGDADAVRSLLSASANPCVQNDAGRTPMQLSPSAEIVAVYIQELLQSVAQSKLGRVCQMLSSGVPIDSVDSATTQNSALHYAASYGSEDVVRVLCEGGANVNAVNARGDTPLHDAILRGDIHVVKQLLHYGANPSIRSFVGLDCYETARERAANKPEILQCLSMYRLASGGGGDDSKLSAASKNSSSSLLSLNDDLLINGTATDAGNIKSPNQNAKPADGQPGPRVQRFGSLTMPSSPISSGQDPRSSSIINNFHDVKIENWSDYLWPQPKFLHLLSQEQVVADQNSSSSFRLPDRKLRIFMLAGSELTFRDIMHVWNLYGPQFSSMQISMQFEYQLQKVYSESGSGVCCGVYPGLFNETEAYSLQIQECGVELLAGDLRGLKHGASTLAQIVRIFHQRETTTNGQGLALPRLCIKDWPDTAYRACLVDFSGCRIFGTDTLLKIASRLAYVKANQLMVHFEQRVQDRHFSLPYSHKELFQLRQQCADMCLEFVPSLDLNSEELDARMASDILQKFFERFPDCRCVHFGVNFSAWLVRNPETFVVAVPSSVRHIYLAVKDASVLSRQKLQALPPFCTLCVQAKQLLPKEANNNHNSNQLLYGNSSLCLTFLTSDVGYLCQAPEEMIRNALIASKLGDKYRALSIMSCDLSTGCEIVPQSLAFLPELAVLGVGWNRQTDMRRFCFFLPHVASEHVLSDRKMTSLFQQILTLGFIEHELSKIACGPAIPNMHQRKASTSSVNSLTAVSGLRMPPLSIFVQILLNPDSIDLEAFTPVIFKKVRIDLTRVLQALHNLKKELPYNFDLALCVAEVQLITELMILATKLGQALCLIGSNPRQDFGSPVINLGISNLSLTSRTDLANKLLEVRTQFQHAWLSRNLAGTLPNALKIFDNLFKTLLPPALQEYGENLL